MNNHPYTGHSKEKKSLEDNVASLREELRSLYDMLKDKNDQLIGLEKEIRDRDISIRFLKNEFKKLKEQNLMSSVQLATAIKNGSVCNCNCKSSTPTQSARRNANTNTSAIICHRNNNNDSTYDCSDNANHDPVMSLKRDLQDRELLIRDLNQKIIRLSEDLTYVQRQSLEKDAKITELRNEIDKFRQVVRPLTQAMLERRRSGSYDEWSTAAPGIESTRIFTISEPRIKRQAISAEPLSSMAGVDGDLIKIPKSYL